MSSRSLAALLVAGCLTAAAGGAYVAVRQNAAPQPAVAVPVAAAPAPAASPQPVSETEALVGRTPAAPADRPQTRRRRPSRRRPHRSLRRRPSLNGPTRFGPARRRGLNPFPKRERRPAVAPQPADRGPADRGPWTLVNRRPPRRPTRCRRPSRRSGRKLRPPLRPRLSLYQSPSARRSRRRLLLSRSSKKSCCPPPQSWVSRWIRRCRASVRGSRIGSTRG